MIRLAVLVISLGFSGVLTASGGYQVFNSGSLQGLKDSEGGVLIPPVYDALGWSDGQKTLVQEVIGYYENGKWGLINSKNKRITPAKYAVLVPYDLQFVKAAIKGQFTNHLYYGLLTSDGKAQIDFHYFDIEKWTDELHLVSEYREGNVWYGVSDGSGKQLIPLDFKEIKEKGSLLVATKKDRSLWLYYPSGLPVFEGALDRIEELSDGLSVWQGGKVGWISFDGSPPTPIAYKSFQNGRQEEFPSWEVRLLNGSVTQKVACDSLSVDEKGTLIAHYNHVEQLLGGSELLLDRQKNDLKYLGGGFMIVRNRESSKWSLHKTDGRLLAAEYDSIAVDPSYFYARKDKGWDIYSFFGRRLNEWPLEAVGSSFMRNIPVKKNGYWGWFDFEGNQLISFKYDQVTAGLEGQFLAKYIGSWGVADFSDAFVVSPRYTSIQVKGNHYLARRDAFTAVLDMSGAERYKTAAIFAETEPLTFQEGGKWSILFANGIIKEARFDSVTFSSEFVCGYEGGYVSVYELNGVALFTANQKIERIFGFSEGLFHVQKDGLHGFVDAEGRLRIANRYENATLFSDSLAAIRLRGRWGLIDMQERLIVQPFYQEIVSIQDNHAIVKLKNEFGLIRKDGQEILGLEWQEIRHLPTGNYLLTSKEGKQGLADANGRILLSATYTRLTDTEAGLILATQSGKMGVLDYQGYTKVPFSYTKIEQKGDYLLLQK